MRETLTPRRVRSPLCTHRPLTSAFTSRRTRERAVGPADMRGSLLVIGVTLWNAPRCAVYKDHQIRHVE